DGGRYDLPFRTIVLPSVPLGYLNTGRGKGSRAGMLGNGKIIVSGSGTTVEIYDPATKVSTQLVATMTTARNQHTATLLPNGKVLLVGGRDAGGNYLAT